MSCIFHPFSMWADGGRWWCLFLLSPLLLSKLIYVSFGVGWLFVLRRVYIRVYDAIISQFQASQQAASKKGSENTKDDLMGHMKMTPLLSTPPKAPLKRETGKHLPKNLSLWHRAVYYSISNPTPPWNHPPIPIYFFHRPTNPFPTFSFFISSAVGLWTSPLGKVAGSRL